MLIDFANEFILQSWGNMRMKREGVKRYPTAPIFLRGEEYKRNTWQRRQTKVLTKLLWFTSEEITPVARPKYLYSDTAA